MIDMRYKPLSLPQVSAPYTHVVGELDKEGIGWDVVDMDPTELNPMQGVVFSNEVGDFDLDDMDPIWISRDNEIMDGHHRFLKAHMIEKPIKCVKIDLIGKDGCRVLNKIQDIYDYEQQRGLEEVVVQDVLNAANDKDADIEDKEFLGLLETMDLPEPKPAKVVAYRQQPIKENSVIGNFFLIEPVDGYDKYEIEFDNLLDTNDLGLEFGDNNPVEVLTKTWFPNADFEKLGESLKISSIHLKNKAIAERCQKMGYDGIRYGDKMIQGLK